MRDPAEPRSLQMEQPDSYERRILACPATSETVAMLTPGKKTIDRIEETPCKRLLL